VVKRRGFVWFEFSQDQIDGNDFTFTSFFEVFGDGIPDKDSGGFVEVGGVGNASIAFLNKVVVDFGEDIGFSSNNKVLGQKEVGGFGWAVSNHSFDLHVCAEFLIEESKAFQSAQRLAPRGLEIIFIVPYVLSDPRTSPRLIATHEFNDSGSVRIEENQGLRAMAKWNQ